MLYLAPEASNTSWKKRDMPKHVVIFIFPTSNMIPTYIVFNKYLLNGLNVKDNSRDKRNVQQVEEGLL